VLVLAFAMKINDYGLSELRSFVRYAGLSAPAVSDWSVGMHVHHCCLAMIEICRAISDSTPPPPRVRWSLVTLAVFLSGRIPRGRGRSPEIALPKQDVTEVELSSLLDQCQRSVAETMKLASGSWFRHFAFGVLNRDKALKLVRIHNRHHLRIIADIAGPDGRKSW